MNASSGSTYDTSPFIRSHLWEPTFFNTEDASFPSVSPEERERFVGISENFGHDTTFKILNSSTNKIINSSNVRSSNYDKSPSLLANPVTSTEVIKLLREVKFEAEDLASETSPNDEDPGSETSTNDSPSSSSSLRPMPEA